MVSYCTIWYHIVQYSAILDRSWIDLGSILDRFFVRTDRSPPKDCPGGVLGMQRCPVDPFIDQLPDGVPSLPFGPLLLQDGNELWDVFFRNAPPRHLSD